MSKYALGVAITLVSAGACTGSPSSTNSEAAQLAAWYASPGVVQWEHGLEVGGVIYACGGWATQRPPEVPIIVDLIFSALINVASPGPAPQSVQAVLKQGGTIIHEFSFPGVRAALRPAAIEQLVGTSLGTVANVAVAAPPSGSGNVRTSIVVDEGVETAVVQTLETLGGVIWHVSSTGTGISAVVPASKLLDLASAPGVRSVEVFSVGCLF